MIESRDVKLMLARMTFPARRHRCPECNRVFQCHLCTLEVTHELHTEYADCPFFCLECAERAGCDSVAVLDTHVSPSEVRFYDYRTGKMDLLTGWIRGWETDGRSDGMWRFCERLFNGVKRFVGRGV